VFGSAMALAGRGGVIHLDEAWVFLGAGKAEVERLGDGLADLELGGQTLSPRAAPRIRRDSAARSQA